MGYTSSDYIIPEIQRLVKMWRKKITDFQEYFFENNLRSPPSNIISLAEMPFSSIPPEDKLWACYSHACNTSLRDRFV